jgi:spore germination cell wall hydrolase CwlJ-like protein
MRARRGSLELTTLKGVAGLVTVVLGLAGMTNPAFGPADGTLDVAKLVAPAETRATIDFLGAAPVITGSVDHMFLGSGFVGPNRAAKTDRARYIPDVIEVASSFQSLRQRLMTTRAASLAARLTAAQQVATTSQPLPTTAPPDAAPVAQKVTPAAAAERIAIAAVSPRAVSQALDAIDGLATAPGAPMPRMLTQQSAYARADVPATVFGLRDKAGQEVSDKELWCLATAIYFEARGEAYRGQVGVAQVVLNRVKHHLYPSTICSVVFQNQHMRNACQFSFACDGIADKVTDQKSWKQADEIARGVIKGDLYLAEVGAATHYHATYVKPRWAPRMQKLTQIGLHVFYEFKRGWRFG